MEVRKGARPPKGRKDENGQEAVIKLKVIEDREKELVRLHGAAKDAAEDFSTAITKASEDSGLNAAAVRKFIAAKAGDRFEAEQKKVEQLSLVFGVA